MVKISIITQLNENTCFDSILNRSFNDFEILCLGRQKNGSLINELQSKFDENIKFLTIAESIDEVINQVDGEYILFLDINQNLNDNSLKNALNQMKYFDLDLLISPNDIFQFYNNDCINKVSNALEVGSKFLFKTLNYSFSVFIKKSFLTDNNLKIYENKSLFLLNCLINANKLIFSDEIYVTDVGKLNKSYKIDFNYYYDMIDSLLQNTKLYEKLKLHFWKFIFDDIYDIFFNLRDETIKREYYYDCKILFDKYCFDKGYYNDIHNTVDIVVLEFFKQSLMDVCFIPNKRYISQRLVRENYKPLTIAIKSNGKTREFDKLLKKFFNRRGFKVLIHEKEDWYLKDSHEDIALFLPDNEMYIPNEKHINVIWNIFNDESVSIEEYDAFDVVFISSKNFAEDMAKKLDGVVKHLKFENKLVKKQGKVKEISEDIIETLRNITF